MTRLVKMPRRCPPLYSCSFERAAMSNPYQSPQFAAGQAPPLVGGIDREKLRRVARYQQYVIYALLANIVINISSFAIRGQQNVPLAFAFVFLALALVVIVCAIVAIFLLANELMGVAAGILCGF